MHIEVRIYFCTSFLCIINKSHNILRLFVCARGGIGRHDGFRCCHLGERFFRGSSPRTFFGKSRLACFYKRGSSVTLRHGFPRRVKTEDNKIAAGIPAAHICGYGGNGRLGGFRCCHLGERFFRGSSPRTFFGKSRLACFYKRGSSVTLRHGFPRRVKTEDNKIAAGIPAAHICGYGGNGRLGGFRFLCREACGFESHYPYQRPTCIL